MRYEQPPYFFCHAGVRPHVALAAQAEEDLMWIRYEFLNSDSDHGAVIVHGHTPVREAEVRPNRICVDTGAYASGVLTAAVLEGSEVRFLSTNSSAKGRARRKA
jgi:serine/threonine protein phosphatase 1